jgi:hypothetical protein
MVRKIDKFQESMKASKELYTKELERYARQYSALSERTLKERPDIDTMDYLYSFKRTDGICDEELDMILGDLYNHMNEFARANGISEFYMHSVISFKG